MKSRLSAGKVFLTAVLGACAYLPQLSSAAIVSFEYAGTITQSQDSGNLLGGAFKIGDPYVGRVSYDTANSQTYFAPGVYYFLSGAQIALTSGGHTFVGSTSPSTSNCWPSASPDCIAPFSASVTNNGMAEGDRLAYSGSYLKYDGTTPPASPTRGLLQLRLVDPSQKALTDNALPTTAPSLSAFEQRQVEFFASGADFMSRPLYSFSGSVTSITPVPEPGTISLLAVGLSAVLGWTRNTRRRAGGK
jgi:hypothetical protein